MKIFYATAIAFALGACREELLTPRHAAYGELDQPLVIGLKIFDPFIEGKNVQLKGDLKGSARLVLNNTYIVYQPAPQFPQDETALEVDGDEIVRITFAPLDLSAPCLIHANAFDLSIAKNSSPSTHFFDFTLCGGPVADENGLLITIKPIEPIEGIKAFASFAKVGFEFLPSRNFSGSAELIYEISYRDDENFMLPGLLRIIVTD